MSGQADAAQLTELVEEAVSPSQPTAGTESIRKAADYNSLPPVLHFFWTRSVMAWVLMFIIAFLEAVRGIQRPDWNPLDDPTFGDLLENLSTYRFLHTADFWTGAVAPQVAYPPFAAVCLKLFYASGAPSASYALLALCSLSFAIGCTRQALLREGVEARAALHFPLTLAMVSFPVEGLLQRGNIELVLWIFAAAGIWLFLDDHDQAAAVFWALAASMKLYPLIFFVLFLPRRRYKAAALGVVSFFAISIGSLLYLGPSLKAAWVGSLRGVFGYQGLRVADWNLHELAENHSFFNWVKAAAVLSGHSAARLTLPYYVCGAILFAVLFFGRLARMPVANQLLGVSTFMVLLPPVSYFYTLVHLYAPWMVLVFLALRAAHGGVFVPGLRSTIVLFLPIFASYTLLTFPTFLIFGGLVQSACLVALLLCALRFPFECRHA